jgi:dTDP-4-amino-4,6-dideoxygalactose transaminase
VIPLAVPVLEGNEKRYLQECIETGYVSSVGPFVERFERAFADFVGVPHAVACSSGTAALHVALRLAGAKPGKTVAVSDFTFVASANAVSYTGADVLLVDSERHTWNMNTELLHDEVVRRARSGQSLPDIVEVVHVLGHPAFIEPLLDLQQRFGIRIVEDAAESLGASWAADGIVGAQVGSVGDLGCFSFNGNKTITSGGGGMIVTADSGLARAAKHLSNQAKVAGGHYVHDTVGYNYRLTNIAAAVGLAQLERLPRILELKQAIAGRYRAWLGSTSLRPAPAVDWAHSSHWLYSVLLPPEVIQPAELITGMAATGIEARRVWPPVHQQRPYVNAARLGGGIATEIYECGISLPSSASLTRQQQKEVTGSVKRLLASKQRLTL